MNFFEYIEYAASGVSYKDWLLVFGVGLGVIIGLIVLVIGLTKNKKKIGIIGSISALAGNSAVGLILGLPIAIIFIWLILKPNKDSLLDAEEEEDLKDIELDESDFKEEKEDK